MQRSLTILFLVLTLPGAYAQEVYENRVFVPDIRTVEFHNTSEEQTLPVLELGGSDHLMLSFDDLRGGFRAFYYTIEHCTAEWKPSADRKSTRLNSSH